MTAGCGFATTEMLLVMYDIVMSAQRCHPSVQPFLFVDDLCFDSRGPLRHIKRELVGFLDIVCRRIREDGGEISNTKPLFTASSPCVTKALAGDMRRLGLRHSLRCQPSPGEPLIDTVLSLAETSECLGHHGLDPFLLHLLPKTQLRRT